MLFPEGTRFSPLKHKESLKFSEKNGLPSLKHHLTPRTKGFTTGLMAMRGKIDALYDVNLAFKKNDKVLTIKTSKIIKVIHVLFKSTDYFIVRSNNHKFVIWTSNACSYSCYKNTH